MTPAGMASLRIAATVAHALPGIRVRLRREGATVLEVTDPCDAAGPALGPCAFRVAVARAYGQMKSGARLGFMGLPDGTEPAVDIAVRAGDRVLPGGIYRVAIGDQTVVGFATTLSPGSCHELLAERAGTHVFRLHHDSLTEVTFVHSVMDTDLGSTGWHVRLEDALAAVLADEIEHELAAGPTRPPG